MTRMRINFCKIGYNYKPKAIKNSHYLRIFISIKCQESTFWVISLQPAHAYKMKISKMILTFNINVISLGLYW